MRRFEEDNGNPKNKITYSDEDITRMIVLNTLDLLGELVEQQVCNSNGVLIPDPVGLGPQLKEVPVWGIDSNTRRLLELLIRDVCRRYPALVVKGSTIEKTTDEFIERVLLPSINAQEPSYAHDMTYALDSITDVRAIKFQCMSIENFIILCNYLSICRLLRRK
jgi:hypothetical protein